MPPFCSPKVCTDHHVWDEPSRNQSVDKRISDTNQAFCFIFHVVVIIRKRRWANILSVQELGDAEGLAKYMVRQMNNNLSNMKLTRRLASAYFIEK